MTAMGMKIGGAEAEIKQETPGAESPCEYQSADELGAEPSPDEVQWVEDRDPRENHAELGRALAASGDIFRTTHYDGGLLLVIGDGSEVVQLQTPTLLDSAIKDRVAVTAIKNGKLHSRHVPTRSLKAMLHCDSFLEHFPKVDFVSRVPCFGPEFDLCQPGLNTFPGSENILYLDDEAEVSLTPDALSRFLDALPFASEADRTAVVGAAITALLRNHWVGAKPVVLATANKSHSGKTTLVDFIAGNARAATVIYQSTDWAFRHHFVRALGEGGVSVINVDNARVERRGSPFIASGFLESFLTDPQPSVSTVRDKTHETIANRFLVAITTNDGTVSTDLLNRALPIHLHLEGDVAERIEKFGNLRHEFLPAHRDQIQAELLGLIERWKKEGAPRCEGISHPCTGWAQSVGGILQVNGYSDFLANRNIRKTLDDPLRHALGLLGGMRPDEWLRPAQWAALTADLGLVGRLIPSMERESEKSRERAIGCVLSAHVEEVFEVEVDERPMRLVLRRRRGRFDGSQPQTRYRFEQL